jgi:methylenetetrahydrofolate reductase (NADPH)
MLCVSGDSSRMGLTPMARTDAVDIDAVQMLWILRRMRDEKKYLDQRSIETPPTFFLGAAASPFSSEPHFQALREQKKVNAGAQFFQTNAVFDAGRLDIWLNELAKRNILDKVYILIGIVPLKSLKMTQYMQKLPGVFLPDAIVKRMETAGDGAQEEGLKITLEIIDAVKRKQGVHGIHIMAVNWEEVVPRIITEAGLNTRHPLFPPLHAGSDGAKRTETPIS